MTLSETRQPGPATVEVCCVGCLVVAARAPCPEPAPLGGSTGLTQLRPGASANVQLPGVCRTRVCFLATRTWSLRTADPTSWVLQDACVAWVFFNGFAGAISDCRAWLELTHMCVAGTR